MRERDKRRASLYREAQRMTGAIQPSLETRLNHPIGDRTSNRQERQYCSAPYLIVGSFRVKVGNASYRTVTPTLSNMDVVKTSTTEYVNRMKRNLAGRKAW